MKPFVAIDGVLDYLLFIFFRCISVEDCAKSEIAVSAYGPVNRKRKYRAGWWEKKNQAPRLVLLAFANE